MANAVTYPDTLEMIVGERLDLTVDFTNVLNGEFINRALIIVSNDEANELVPSAIVGAPFFSGNILHFTLSSAPFRPGTSYVITLIGTTSLGIIVGNPIVVIGTTSGRFGSQTGGNMASILLTVKVIY